MILRNFILIVFVLFLSPLSITQIHAQEQKPPPPSRPLLTLDDISCNDSKVLLDNFALALIDNSNYYCYICYANAKRGKQYEALARATRMKAYLIKVRGIESERIILVDRGYQEQIMFQFYIVPPGATPPEPSPNDGAKDVMFDGVAEIIDEPCGEKKILEPDYSIVSIRCPCGFGMCEVANVNYKDPYDLDIKSALDTLFFELVYEPTKNGYIIVYAGKRSKKDEAKIVAARMKDYLIKDRGLSPDRIEAIDGGYREKPSLDVWLVPEGKEPPKPTPTLKPSEVKVIKNKKTKKRQ